MAVQIPISSLSKEGWRKWLTMLCLEKKLNYKPQPWDKKPDPIMFSRSDNDNVYVPFLFSKFLTGKRPNEDFKPPTFKYNFKGQPKPHQPAIIKEAISIIDKFGCVVLKLYPGCGKSFIATYLAWYYGYLTVVIDPRTLINTGWNETVKVNTDADVWNPGSEWTPNTRFLNCVGESVDKIPSFALPHIGCLIIDEAHMSCTPTHVIHWLLTRVKILIVCTATPERDDDMHMMITLSTGANLDISWFRKKLEQERKAILNKQQLLLQQGKSERVTSITPEEFIDSERERNKFKILKLFSCFIGTKTQAIQPAWPEDSVTYVEISETVVYRKNPKPYNVYELTAQFTPQLKRTIRGESFDDLKKQTASCSEINQWIVDFVRLNYHLHKICVMTPLVELHAEPLYHYMKDYVKVPSVSLIAGTGSKFDDARLLIASISKAGTGFDEALAFKIFSQIRMNVLILIGSFGKSNKVLEQIKGRVDRSEWPTIIVLRIKCKMAASHAVEQREWFLENNGHIYAMKAPFVIPPKLDVAEGAIRIYHKDGLGDDGGYTDTTQKMSAVNLTQIVEPDHCYNSLAILDTLACFK